MRQSLTRVLAHAACWASLVVSPAHADPWTCNGPSGAVAPAAGNAEVLEPERLEALIESLASEVERSYIFPELALEIGARLREQLWEGAYEALSIDELAGRLTVDLQSVNGDRHLRARPIPPEVQRRTVEDPERERERRIDAQRRANFGFRKAEILEGNVGYLELSGFIPTSLAGKTAVATMGFFANVDALIIDLRKNGGGSPSMIQLLTSYFFEEPTHLNSFETRGQVQIDQFWTLPHVPGTKLVGTPLYVLTSGYTFSAAEEFTYNLKNLKRATIVGQTTGGGAHPGGTHAVEGLLSVFIPDGRAINPITGTNWEGTGITPHIEVPTGQALTRALQEAQSVLSETDRGY